MHLADLWQIDFARAVDAHVGWQITCPQMRIRNSSPGPMT